MSNWMSRMICPICSGEKRLSGIGCSTKKCFIPVSLECELCKAVGWIEMKIYNRYQRGQCERQGRIKREITLREEAKRLGISPSRLSRMERGIEDYAEIESNKEERT